MLFAQRKIYLGLALMLILGPTSASAGDFVVALISDGSSRQSTELKQIFRAELDALTVGEFQIEYRDFSGSWSQRTIIDALETAYADPEVDLLLVTGLVANQIAGARASFPKPLFLPIVFDAQLLGLPRDGNRSGHENLNYLSETAGFTANLNNFYSLVPFRKLGLLVDGIILQSVAAIQQEAKLVAAAKGVELVTLPYADPEEDLLALIPPDVDAVMVGGLARLNPAAVDRLIAGLIDRQLPSFSLAGYELVERGMLTADSVDSDFQRLARRTALNIQAVMLGEPASEQSVDFESKLRLLINMQTARAIDVWPRYEVLVEAELTGEELGSEAPAWSLQHVAREALSLNLDLLAQSYGTDAGAEDIRAARANLLPQVSSSLSISQLDGGSLAVASGGAAERSTSGALSVSQLLWSESARANLDIQRHLQRSRIAELEAFRLDTVQTATLAFLDILRLETQFRIQRDNLDLTRANLELASDRVRIGSASAADEYRWQSELATAQQNAITAHAQRVRARENLNRILHRQLRDPIKLTPPSLDDPDLFATSDELKAMIDNPKAISLLTEMFVIQGLERSPELAALQAGIDAKKRELQSAQRSYYHPDLALQAQISRIFEEDRKAGLPMDGDSDWSLGLNATLPLFDGGTRRARISRTGLELKQLQIRFESTRLQIEQGIRSNMHLANASYNNIALAQKAATAADQNLRLVTDSYSQGVVSILQLLDAQSASLRAREAASNAVYNFLIDFLNVQRSVGRFDFFLAADERQRVVESVTNFISNEGSEP